MLQHRAYKFKIYPNQKQEISMTKTIGCSRFVHNYFLDLWSYEYTTTGKGLSYNSCSAMLPQTKRNAGTVWLKEVDGITTQSSLKNLSDTLSRFFKKQNKRPQFKSKKYPIQSYTTKSVNNSIEIRNNFVKLPRLGFVKFAKNQEPKRRILNATIRRNPNDKFFVPILYEEGIVEFPKSSSAIRIDLDITDLAILSNGQKIDNSKFTLEIAKEPKHEQRKLSKRALLAKKKGVNLLETKNYQRQKRGVVRLHEKAVNQCNDFLDKLSTGITRNHDIICIEDLNAKGMSRNHKLAKSISDVSRSSFVTKLQYKANWYDRKIIKINERFLSSQICSSYKYKDNKKSLEIREWICPVCRAHHGQDINAGTNILARDLRLHVMGLA